jgi:hypothetical protein
MRFFANWNRFPIASVVVVLILLPSQARAWTWIICGLPCEAVEQKKDEIAAAANQVFSSPAVKSAVCALQPTHALCLANTVEVLEQLASEICRSDLPLRDATLGLACTVSKHRDVIQEYRDGLARARRQLEYLSSLIGKREAYLLGIGHQLDMLNQTLAKADDALGQIQAEIRATQERVEFIANAIRTGRIEQSEVERLVSHEIDREIEKLRSLGAMKRQIGEAVAALGDATGVRDLVAFDFATEFKASVNPLAGSAWAKVQIPGPKGFSLDTNQFNSLLSGKIAIPEADPVSIALDSLPLVVAEKDGYLEWSKPNQGSTTNVTDTQSRGARWTYRSSKRFVDWFGMEKRSGDAVGAIYSGGKTIPGTFDVARQHLLLEWVDLVAWLQITVPQAADMLGAAALEQMLEDLAKVPQSGGRFIYGGDLFVKPVTGMLATDHVPYEYNINFDPSEWPPYRAFPDPVKKVLPLQPARVARLETNHLAFRFEIDCAACDKGTLRQLLVHRWKVATQGPVVNWRKVLRHSHDTAVAAKALADRQIVPSNFKAVPFSGFEAAVNLRRAQDLLRRNRDIDLSNSHRIRAEALTRSWADITVPRAETHLGVSVFGDVWSWISKEFAITELDIDKAIANGNFVLDLEASRVSHALRSALRDKLTLGNAGSVNISSLKLNLLSGSLAISAYINHKHVWATLGDAIREVTRILDLSIAVSVQRKETGEAVRDGRSYDPKLADEMGLTSHASNLKGYRSLILERQAELDTANRELLTQEDNAREVERSGADVQKRREQLRRDQTTSELYLRRLKDRKQVGINEESKWANLLGDAEERISDLNLNKPEIDPGMSDRSVRIYEIGREPRWRDRDGR